MAVSVLPAPDSPLITMDCAPSFPRMRPHIAAVYAFARNADDFADEGDRRPEVLLAGVLLQTGTDRVAFSDIDGGEATGVAFPDEDIDACPCKLRTALRFTQQGAGAYDAQPGPVGFLDQAEAVRYAVGEEDTD